MKRWESLLSGPTSCTTVGVSKNPMVSDLRSNDTSSSGAMFPYGSLTVRANETPPAAVGTDPTVS